MRYTRREFQRIALGSSAWGALTLSLPPLSAESHSPVPFQPFAAQVERLLAALEMLGTPLSQQENANLKTALRAKNDYAQQDDVQKIVSILAPHVLMEVDLNPEMRVSVKRGTANAELYQGGWRTFLVKVFNQAGTMPVLKIKSPQGGPVGRHSSFAITGVHDFTNGAVDEVEARARWLAVSTFDAPPMMSALSGLELEYRIVQFYSRDSGEREATLQADAGYAEQDLGYRSSLPILFHCVPAHKVTVRIKDEKGAASIASVLVKDGLGRVYPPQTKRQMPDLNFQPQVYRYNGESLLLPAGAYTIEYGRGPEYIVKRIPLVVSDSGAASLGLQLERWINPSQHGYYSGDTHIHAAGCSHYESPTEGVTPIVMERQVDGEALDLGSVLNWGPGFDYQKQFFTGHALPMHHAHDAVSMSPSSAEGALPGASAAVAASPEKAGSSVLSGMERGATGVGMAHDAGAIAEEEKEEVVHLLQYAAEAPGVKSLVRYDIETSGFPCSHCGHLVLLRLQDGSYPGTNTIDDWPSWNIPVLQWAKAQGAVVGYAHSAHGLVVDTTALPNYVMPPFNSMGANEFIADVTHEGKIDFISGCDLWPFAELNIWYHTLNCGYRTAFAGETDFPCLTDSCVGGGRSYARLISAPEGDDGYSRWLDTLLHGSSYFGDGRSHLFGFTVAGESRSGELIRLNSSAEIEVAAMVCARLEPQPNEETIVIQHASPYNKPYWHIERARIGESRRVSVELIMNGRAVDRTEIEADGSMQSVRFQVRVRKSSWIALRIYPSSHTNPIFVQVSGKPVRASRKSAVWCRAAVDVCWQQKRQRIRPSELSAAAAAYEHARRAYDQIIAESATEP
ncbi:CehA/McbA family metallohydrolase [Edaphobacter sp. HDX4]|uniref:CehA/McbA family metallohydrolase n=1 Tax=Edaphobacter sp. HDX4 TaxID=2794064 RepID=UPI002FE556AD